MYGGCYERAGRAGFGESGYVARIAHPAAGQQLEVGKARVELAHQRDVGARLGAHACEVEHDHLAYCLVVQPCKRFRRSEPGQLRVPRENATSPQVQAEHERGVG
jgi:hypothetical protein